VERGAIVFLQETHIVDNKQLELIWKHNILSNCIRTNSAGVIILYNKKYDLVHKYFDDEGRQIVAVIQDEERKIIVSNAYFPNDHKQSLSFAETIYTRILEAQSLHPDHLTIYAGDWNVCLEEKDSINRNKSVNEILLSETIVNNNKVTDLSDAYRVIHKEEGFTWKRGKIYSRLDYIYISKHSLFKVVKAETDWAFEASDHAAVKVDLRLESGVVRGPGIVKVNTKILNDPEITLQVGKEIEEMLMQSEKNWNPHVKLEFLKVVIRTVLASKVSQLRKIINHDIKDKEDEVNQYEELRITKLKKNDEVNGSGEVNCSLIDDAIAALKSDLNMLRNKLSNTAAFVSKAKWFEYGEKSNKFFLNLAKSKINQKTISKIKCNGKTYHGQDEVSKGIQEFYGDLYSNQELNKEIDKTFYDNSPKLKNEDMNFLETDLSLVDLQKAILTCKESAPGPDGIPYLIYKKYWKIMGPIILEAWLYSVKTGNMPQSHLESMITLLPKEGKDGNDIKNWRPITLSNCDSKIITKALAMKISKVLDSIIDPTQTAYVPGRSVSDNLRSNFFYKKKCEQENQKAVLVSLDAKKAFDSVDHDYIKETLRAYGFGPAFIRVFETLYNNISARVLINGFESGKIKIKRGVKQGDALSCAIFIICIDPLLRNLNKNKNIKEIRITNKEGRDEKLNFKSAAYADDISVVCKNDKTSIQNIFFEYERLTRKSGLELNADKTEILKLNNPAKEEFEIQYNGLKFKIQNVDKIKICGLFYCASLDEEYNLNVKAKIDKLQTKIKLWSHRHLTMEGKVLIVKTFGLSQIIYNMQSYGFKNEDLTHAERLIFKFLWSTSENPNGIDRIKRSIMKNEYSKGGMKVTDVECLDRSLKLKQFVRACSSKHEISKIQNLLTNGKTMESNFKQEYAKITNSEPICKSAQETLNIIIDYNRETYKSLTHEKYSTDINLLNEVSSINLATYLKRKNKVFMVCMLKPLTENGIITLGDLVQSVEHEKDVKLEKIMKIIISTMPYHLVNVAKCYNEDVNSSNEEVKHILISPEMRKRTSAITVKELQVTLKTTLKRIDELDVKLKLGINNYDEENIIRLRKNVKNPKLRNIYFRLIHNDFFTRVKMKKYKMVDTDKCSRCGQMETLKHLLWDCNDSYNIWNIFNNTLSKLSNETISVNRYDDIFYAINSPSLGLVKIKIIQELIQINRPKNWTTDNLTNIINNLVDIERYNAVQERKLDKFKSKWQNLINK
jgi:exonuclease III